MKHQAVKNAVIVIGNFDGVHKGHQSLLKHARTIADRMNCAMGVLTFDPHPRRYFNPDMPPNRITNLRHKERLLAYFGADFIENLPFNQNIVKKTPEEFVREILIDHLQVAHVVVGYNFKFGKDRSGATEDLVKFGRDLGFDVTVVDAVGTRNDVIYSSSLVREYIRKADFEAGYDALGWHFEIEGTVIHGDKRGREIGYPTANMRLNDYVRPPFGVYAVRLYRQDDDLFQVRHLKGVANIGIRPMFKVEEPLLESFIFDFDEDIYDETLRVQPVAYLRGEEKYSSLDRLVAQIDKDVKQAKEILN